MRRVRGAGVVVGAALLSCLPVHAAQAHPLGNFTVNHYAGLVLMPDSVRVTAVVDRAEIPTAQLLPDLAPDGAPDSEQLSEAASVECSALAGDVELTVDEVAVTWDSRSGTFQVVPGAAGLPTLRLTCALVAAVDLRAAATVRFRDDYLADRIGWREITAEGRGVRLLGSPVPVTSVSDELRRYPDDLLASPLDVRSLEVGTAPGTGSDGGVPVAGGDGDAFASVMAALDRRVQGLVGDAALTPLVGMLAVLLAVLLGCGHALLPGHGKTVMAAYLAARRGRPRDALVVGATVTVTHTVGVLVLGAAIALSATVAGDQVLRWLSVVSGGLVAGVGAAMLRGALRSRAAVPDPARLGDPTLLENPVPPVRAPALVAAAPAPDRHDHAHGHAPGHGHHHAHDHAPGHGHHHGHSHPHDHGHELPGSGAAGRAGLLGMGVAGGLVPSPSALVVLLASVGLGRTVFGLALVLAYGLGMALTLTAVGLSLVRFRDALDRRLRDPGRGRGLRWLARAAPVATAALVLVVGTALVVRGVVLGA